MDNLHRCVKFHVVHCGHLQIPAWSAVDLLFKLLQNRTESDGVQYLTVQTAKNMYTYKHRNPSSWSSTQPLSLLTKVISVVANVMNIDDKPYRT